MEIRATAVKRKWLFTYPGGLTDDVLHAAAGSAGAHGDQRGRRAPRAYIPNFRVKMRRRARSLPRTSGSRRPNPAITLVLALSTAVPSTPAMFTHVTVHPPGGYEAWLAEQKKKLLDLPPGRSRQALVREAGLQHLPQC